MSRRRGSDVDNPGGELDPVVNVQALQEQFSFRFSLHYVRGQKKVATVAAKSGQFTAGEEVPVPLRIRRNLAERVVRFRLQAV